MTLPEGKKDQAAIMMALNLRAACKGKGSISQICREIGINRQQFNKYLAGKSLPSSHNMRAICGYFGLTEQHLLGQGDRVPSGSLGLLPGLGALAGLGADLASRSPRNFATGCYFAYYPMIADPGRIIRVLVVVSRNGDSMTFKRFTRMRDSGIKTKYYPRGKHVGIVLQRGEMIFLLGVNKVGYQDVNLMTFNALMNNSPNMRTGLALIMSPWGPLATRVTLEYIGAFGDRRQMMRRCQILSIDSPEIDPLIRKSLAALSSWPTPQLEPYGHIEDWGALQVVPRAAVSH